MIDTFLCLLMILATWKSCEQKRMELVIENYYIPYYNKSIYYATGNIYFFNRTTKCLNTTWMFYVQPSIDTKFVMKGYRWESNEYRLSAIQFSYPVKYLIGGTSVVDLVAAGNAVKPKMTWPVQLNVMFIMNDYYPHQVKLTPGMPEGRYLFKLSYVGPNDDYVMSTSHIHVKIQEAMQY